jgi:ribose transport system ATP-binding protein
MTIIELRHIYKAFGGTQALYDVSFDIRAGEVHALVGENGAGKSTLIKIIMGVLQPDAGEIYVDGRLTTISDPQRARHLGFAAVYQEPLIYPYLTVLENMFVANPILTKTGNIDVRAMREKARPIFEQLGIPENLMEMPAGQLRLGDQQLILIATALLHNTRLLIFDEPTSILSATETEKLFGIIRLLRESNRGVAYISHRLEEITEIADRVTVLTDGKVAGHFESASNVDLPTLFQLVAGVGIREFQTVSPSEFRRGFSQEDVLLEVQNLDNPPYYFDVSWQLHRGEVVGFYGQVGSGRSEMALGIFGSMRPRKGRILLEGKEVKIDTPKHAISLGIGYLPEDRKTQGIFSFQSIRENVVSVVLPRLTWLASHVLKGKTVEVAEQFKNSLRIKLASINDQILSLSGGGQQKVMLARWLAERLKVLILDEPTRGIDVGTKREFHRFIRETANKGLGVVVISSDLPEVLAVADTIYVMRQGRVVAKFHNDGSVRPEDVLRYAVSEVEQESLA